MSNAKDNSGREGCKVRCSSTRSANQGRDRVPPLRPRARLEVTPLGLIALGIAGLVKEAIYGKPQRVRVKEIKGQQAKEGTQCTLWES